MLVSQQHEEGLFLLRYKVADRQIKKLLCLLWAQLLTLSLTKPMSTPFSTRASKLLHKEPRGCRFLFQTSSSTPDLNHLINLSLQTADWCTCPSPANLFLPLRLKVTSKRNNDLSWSPTVLHGQPSATFTQNITTFVLLQST